MPEVISMLERKRGPFSRYRNYITYLGQLLDGEASAKDWESKATAALNGQASAELRRLSTLTVRRKYGTYFTGTDLAGRLAGHCTTFGPADHFYDPTCGMGDLLLAAARQLPLGNNLKETIKKWGDQLSGCDLHAEFILGAKVRLGLLAKQRHQANEKLDPLDKDFFPHLQVGDGLTTRAHFTRASVLLMNPPFGLTKAPLDCDWAGGRVSAAAIFIINALEQASAGTKILAILPEVLRSGSFSEHWRKKVSDLAEVQVIETCGIFDNSADVDVFILSLRRRCPESGSGENRWPAITSSSEKKIQDWFDVHVGRVVPHRDPEVGPKHAYIHPRGVPPWATVTKFSEYRKYDGLLYSPPLFIVKSFIEEHSNGTITALARGPLGGARFTIQVPSVMQRKP